MLIHNSFELSYYIISLAKEKQDLVIVGTHYDRHVEYVPIFFVYNKQSIAAITLKTLPILIYPCQLSYTHTLDDFITSLVSSTARRNLIALTHDADKHNIVILKPRRTPKKKP